MDDELPPLRNIRMRGRRNETNELGTTELLGGTIIIIPLLFPALQFFFLGLGFPLLVSCLSSYIRQIAANLAGWMETTVSHFGLPSSVFGLFSTTNTFILEPSVSSPCAVHGRRTEERENRLTSIALHALSDPCRQRHVAVRASAVGPVGPEGARLEEPYPAVVQINDGHEKSSEAMGLQQQ
jgi:hypothetical protein